MNCNVVNATDNFYMIIRNKMIRTKSFVLFVICDSCR